MPPLNTPLLRHCFPAHVGLNATNSTFRPTLPFLRARACSALARLSYRNSVGLSVTRVDQSKTVQARITKSLPSAAWKTLVLGFIKLFHKIERVTLSEGAK